MTTCSRRSNPLAAACLLLAAACAHTQPTGAVLPTRQPDRISDEAIARDYQAFESLQGRIRALNESGVVLRNYHLAKAQGYLDLAFDEYHENDRSDVIEAALREAVSLVEGLESRSPHLPTVTPDLPDSERLRPDLWAQADALKSHAGFACAAPSVARLEIALLHAGHEVRQGGWRRAWPHIEVAEDLAARAQVETAVCSGSGLESPRFSHLTPLGVAGPTLAR